MTQINGKGKISQQTGQSEISVKAVLTYAASSLPEVSDPCIKADIWTVTPAAGSG